MVVLMTSTHITLHKSTFLASWSNNYLRNYLLVWRRPTENHCNKML